MSDKVDQQEELEQLRNELRLEKQKSAQLEDECDALASEILRLQEELKSKSYGQRESEISSVPVMETLEVFIEGDGNYTKKKFCQIQNACEGKNVICVAFLKSATAIGEESTYVLCGGVDSNLNCYQCIGGEKLFTIKLSSPLLALDVKDYLIACSMMDGTVAVVKFDPMKSLINQEKEEYLQLIKDHSKYVISVQWSPCGQYLATASHDKSVNIYCKRDGEVFVEKVKTIHFSSTPECLTFRCSQPGILSGSVDNMPPLPPSTSLSCCCELIVGLRDSAHLVCVDCISFNERRLCLNEQEFDTHVSFTPLMLSLQPAGDLLLIATDKNMHVVMNMLTLKRVRILASHASGQYGKPSVCWDLTGKYVYSNSEEESVVYVYSVASGKVVHRLSGEHTAIVRGVATSTAILNYGEVVNVLATASYDKSVILWT
mmetsp:Transcript_28159/g.40092  ORF Transcript_28159/g.40092 Transcript_28159/m.40092 type:complete len:431 (+) Transcript_28159:27-1319(+)